MVDDRADQTTACRCGEQVPRAVIERLCREREGSVSSRCLSASVSDSAAHLNEAVETSSARPRAGEAIRVVRHVHERRVDLAAAGRSEPQAVHRVRTQAMDHHVCSGDESFETLSVAPVVQIQEGTAFSDRHFGQ
jgi:hypothetical protein